MSMPPIRRWAKHVIEGVLLGLGIARGCRLRFRGRGVILAYHNVIPDDAKPAGDRSLHLPRREFSAQLECLAETHEVVSLKALLDQPFSASSRRPRAAITFDDAYRGALQFGLSELGKRGFPATVFVTPGLLGNRPFWWDILAEEYDGVIPFAIRSRALAMHRGFHDEVLGHEPYDTKRAERMPAYSRSANLEELKAAVAHHDLDVGAHTWSHPNLTKLSDPETCAELNRTREWLAREFPDFLPWLAYPYGLFNLQSERLTREVYSGGLTLAGGFSAPRLEEDRSRIPRMNIPAGVSLRGFELRTAGVFG